MLFVAIAATLAMFSCAKEDGQTGSSGQSEGSIVGKTLYTDLYCALTEDGFMNRQYEFRFSTDNVLYIREGKKIQSSGEMRWGDPIHWTYTIDNSVITVEGDYSNDHLIKMGNIISGNKIKWEGQSAFNEDEEDYISFKEVFKYGLTISTSENHYISMVRMGVRRRDCNILSRTMGATELCNCIWQKPCFMACT